MDDIGREIRRLASELRVLQEELNQAHNHDLASAEHQRWTGGPLSPLGWKLQSLLDALQSFLPSRARR